MNSGFDSVLDSGSGLGRGFAPGLDFSSVAVAGSRHFSPFDLKLSITSNLRKAVRKISSLGNIKEIN